MEQQLPQRHVRQDVAHRVGNGRTHPEGAKQTDLKHSEYDIFDQNNFAVDWNCFAYMYARIFGISRGHPRGRSIGIIRGHPRGRPKECMGFLVPDRRIFRPRGVRWP